ncbi:winged helix-turn-helix transcriptional regulator [Spirosoma endophyticum]|uniref:Transcriptional regulator, HxlR family n=1 Tax=Spirosoma endophyticum TaxID=662367 RepID=A0A1I1R8V7_9BACT|nr:helix-turn-helix domain-containing protein [Spirosoma endophyticum]SFD30745.1 transcriptional regulator, HxlR family [Spirosoma endophyticum]
MTGDRSDLPLVPDLNLINQSLAIVCGKWRLYIILLLGKQTLRYGKISEMLPGVSEKVLASELKTLVALGVMKRKAYAEIPPRVEYTLTKKGLLILPILKQIQEIGRIFN